MISVCGGVWLALVAVAAGEVTVQNAGFEEVVALKPGADGLVNGWKLTDPATAPKGWSLNVSYPGELSLPTDGAHAGQRHLKLTAGARDAHVYQMLTGLEAGQWYKVSAWLRKGRAVVGFYEYSSGPPPQPRYHLCAQLQAGDRWEQTSGYFRPVTEGFKQAALVVHVPANGSVEVDDMRVQPLNLPPVDPNSPPLVFENPRLRFAVSTEGRVVEFRDKVGGQSYLAEGVPFPLVTATRDGATQALHRLERDGEMLTARFLDDAVRVKLRLITRDSHFRIEIVEVQPDDLDSVTVELPVKRLAKVGGAFGATYDDTFGACLFCLTPNATTRMIATTDLARLRGVASRRGDLVGAAFALVAAPADKFQAAVMDTEKANGLPCPMLGGEWARVSKKARQSYLFATDASEENTDKLIEYARIGGFGTIIYLKNNVFANHGHFDINPTNFPHGLDGLKQSMAKIRAAGMDVGVHVFGPSVSPDDPYVTPKPDDRLLYVPCPPLLEALDEKSATIALAGEPPMPPKGPESRAFPGRYLRIDDEIIAFGEAQAGPPFRYTGCRRGALGTKAAAHAPGAQVRGMLAMWGFFLVDPDSTLADEVTANFAKVANACSFDLVYFDASDGILNQYTDGAYYRSKMHLAYYRKLAKDVLYQTSTGTGSDLLWHLVPRSASADGHGDIKGYLDDRWPGILNMGNNWTKADIGWYYWFRDVRPDQIEYVCAKAVGVEGSISLETSREALERLAQSRQMMETIGAWERCRAADPFGAEIKAKLREPKKDFKVFGAGKSWSLYRAAYEEPVTVDQLDGRQNVWTIKNELGVTCDLGVELVRGSRPVPTADYGAPGALTIETFDDATPYAGSQRNDFEKFVQGGDKQLTETGPVRSGVTQRYTLSKDDPRVGPACLVYAAENQGEAGGWGGIGRRFAQPLDLKEYRALALWLHGDGKLETIRVQLRDSAGKYADWTLPINFTNWRLVSFDLPQSGFDASRVEYLLFYFNNIPEKMKVEVRFDDVKLLKALQPPGAIGRPVLEINGRAVEFPVELSAKQAITVAGPDGVKLWPGGMAASKSLKLQPDAFRLKPGENKVTFTTSQPKTYPGDVQVLLYRLWPMEK